MKISEYEGYTFTAEIRFQRVRGAKKVCYHRIILCLGKSKQQLRSDLGRFPLGRFYDGAVSVETLFQ